MRKYWKLTRPATLSDCYHLPLDKRVEVETLAEADLVSSAEHGTTDMHLPLFDLDFGAELLPSSTPGHFHLYLDKRVSWRSYRRVLMAMSKAGLLEEGWVRQALRDGQAYLRAPAVVKAESPRTDAEVLAAVARLQAVERELVEEGTQVDPDEDKRFWERIHDERVAAEEEQAADWADYQARLSAWGGYGPRPQLNRRVSDRPIAKGMTSSSGPF